MNYIQNINKTLLNNSLMFAITKKINNGKRNNTTKVS